MNSINLQPAHSDLHAGYDRISIPSTCITDRAILRQIQEAVTTLGTQPTETVNQIPGHDHIIPARLQPEIEELFIKEDEIIAMVTMGIAIPFDYRIQYHFKVIESE